MLLLADVCGELVDKKPDARMLLDLRIRNFVSLLYSAIRADHSTSLKEYLQVLSTCSDNFDFSAEFSRLGGHAVLKKLLANSDNEIIELVEEVVCAILSSGVSFPMTRVMDVSDIDEIAVANLPMKFSYRHSSLDQNELSEHKHLYIRSIPGKLHGIGQEAVGRILWPSATILSRWLIKNSEILRGKRVLEIGAGVGLVGIVSASLGAQSVTLSDYSDNLLSNLSMNIELNSGHHLVEGCVGAIPPTCCVDVRKLNWSDGSFRSSSPPTNLDDCISFAEYDILVGSDLICCREDTAGVVGVVVSFLAQSSSSSPAAIIVVPGLEHRYESESVLQYSSRVLFLLPFLLPGLE